MAATVAPVRGSTQARSYHSRETRRNTPRNAERLPSAPRPDHLRLVRPAAATSLQLSPWRRLLRAAKAARDVDVATGRTAPLEVARTFAYAIGYSGSGYSDLGYRNRATSLVMGLSFRGKLHVDVREVRRIWAELAALHQEATAPTPRPRAPYQEENGRERIPVEKARAVPIAQVFAHLGHRLRSTGHSLIGRCPLPDHEDSTPSLSVDPKKKVWYCHGCHRGGDSITLVRMVRGVDFRAAVEEIVSAC